MTDFNHKADTNNALIRCGFTQDEANLILKNIIESVTSRGGKELSSIAELLEKEAKNDPALFRYLVVNAAAKLFQ